MYVFVSHWREMNKIVANGFAKASPARKEATTEATDFATMVFHDRISIIHPV